MCQVFPGCHTKISGMFRALCIDDALLPIYRTVQVIKLISKDSIEACMLRLGQEKLKLEQDMTTDDGECKPPCANLYHLFQCIAEMKTLCFPSR